MGHLYETARFGSHADRAVCGKRGLVKPVKSLRFVASAVANALTVASTDTFNGARDFKEGSVLRQ